MALANKAVKTAELALFPKSEEIQVSLNGRTTPEEAQHAVEQVCTALSKRLQSASYLNTLLGQLAVEVKTRKLYQPQFRTFEEYTESLTERFGFGRSTIREAMLVVQAFPKLDAKAVQDIPFHNMRVAARVARQDPELTPTQILKGAGATNREYRQHLAKRGLLHQLGRPAGGSRRSGLVDLRITCSAIVARRFREQAGKWPQGDQGKYLAHLLMRAK